MTPKEFIQQINTQLRSESAAKVLPVIVLSVIAYQQAHPEHARDIETALLAAMTGAGLGTAYRNIRKPNDS
jgi:hypothetical protein